MNSNESFWNEENTTANDVLVARAQTYALLSRLFFKEVDEALINQLAAIRLPMDSPNDTTAQGARLMMSYLAHRPDDAATQLAVDFARLFLVRTRSTKKAAYPFESVYTTIDHTTMGNARDAVVALYRKAGLDASDSWNLGEDHIALELEYVATLAQRSADAFAQGNTNEARELLKQQKSFLDAHLLRWTPAFVEAMIHDAQTDFYHGLALMLAGVLEDDSALLVEAC